NDVIDGDDLTGGRREGDGALALQEKAGTESRAASTATLTGASGHGVSMDSGRSADGQVSALLNKDGTAQTRTTSATQAIDAVPGAETAPTQAPARAAAAEPPISTQSRSFAPAAAKPAI